MSINPGHAGWLVGLLLAASLVLRNPPVFLLAFTLGVGLYLAHWWSRTSLVGLIISRSLSQSRAFFGDSVELSMEVANPRILPVPWLELRDEVPSRLPIAGAHLESHYTVRRLILVNALSLRWFERVRRRYRIHCVHRGLHRYGPATVRTGDLFGLFEREAVIDDRDELIIYPRVLPVQYPEVPSARPGGTTRGNPWLFEDPERVQGIRPYTPSDPMRRVHWKATARTGSLQVKVHEPTYSASLAVFLDIATYRELWQRIDEAGLEFLITTAASLLLDAYERGLAVGLYTNGVGPRARTPVRIFPGRSRRHIMDALEALALVGPVAALPLVDLVAMERPGFPFGMTILAVTTDADSDLIEELQRCQASGCPSALVLTSPTHTVSGPIPIRTAVEEATPDGAQAITIR